MTRTESKIKYITTTPQFKSDSNVPIIGNASVYPMIGVNDRPAYTNTNGQKIIYTPRLPPISSIACGNNTLMMGDSTYIRNATQTKTKKSSFPIYCGYSFGDVSVDGDIVQNVNNIVSCLGPVGGVSSRQIQRNLANMKN